ncbi:MAG: response regulator transcription factor [Candidatus Aminicenantes bacterium]|nr:response regulator transcription factor [Candidatus Aminicenantes bacterium]
MPRKKTKPENKATAQEAKEKIKLLIYCPSDLILTGILKALENDRSINIVTVERGTMENFMESIRQLAPQVILFAHLEPLPHLKEICKAIKETIKPQIKTQLLLLGNIPSHEEIINLINAGARGYFDLNDPATQLAEAIRVVNKGEIWLPRDKMSSIMDRIISVVGRDMKEKTLDQLTPTEFQVLRLIGQGKSNEEIAQILFISKNTVRSHIKSIYSKLNTHSRLQLALYAINSALF